MPLSDPAQALRICAIGLTVSDIDRSQAFYTQALGFQPISDITVSGQEYSQLEGIPDTAIRIVTLQLGDEQIRLMHYLNLVGTPIPEDSQSNDLWFQHLAIVVQDMDRAYAHLQPFLTESISDAPQTIPPSNPAAAGVRAFKFKDPDRHDLELIWFPPDKRQDKWQQHDRLFLGIDHSAITIADTEQSLQFYRDLLGMQVAGGSLNQGETQARLDGLPVATVRITALRPAQGGLGIELLDYQMPSTDRPIPSSWQSFDIAHMQIELVVPDLEPTVEQLRQHGVPIVSAQRVQSVPPDCQGCLVKDPTGHAILLLSAPLVG